MIQRCHKIAILGHPNAGKTTLFNAVTQGQACVGNWPGVTLLAQQGQDVWCDQTYEWVDLPGIYSVVKHPGTAADAQQTIDWMQGNPQSHILNVVLAEEVSQQLFLTLQLLERGHQSIVLLNFKWASERAHWIAFASQLEKRLGIAVLAVNLAEDAGDHLRANIYRALATAQSHDYQSHIDALQLPEAYQTWITSSLASGCIEASQGKQLLMGWLEEDQWAASDLEKYGIQSLIAPGVPGTDSDPCLVIAEARYRRCQSIVDSIRGESTRNHPLPESSHPSEGLDKFFLSPVWSLPIFVATIATLFFLAFHVGAILAPWLKTVMRIGLIEPIRALPDAFVDIWLVDASLQALNFAIDLLAEMLPQLALLFLGMNILESSGYLARVAFLTDGLMQIVGLSGKSCLPLLLGFGCSVPGIEATEGLDSSQERLQTMLMIPLLPCGARLLVFSVLSSVMFSQFRVALLLSLYAIGILAGLLTAKFLQKILHARASDRLSFPMPSWQYPRWRHLLRQTGRALVRFARGITPVIFFTSLFVSILFRQGKEQTGPSGWMVDAAIHMTKPLAPIGIEADNWPAAAALVTGLWAKEVLLSTLGTLVQFQTERSSGEIPLQGEKIGATEASVPDLNDLGSGFKTKWALYSYLIFILLYSPCLATVAAIYKNLGLRWATFSFCWSLYLAYGLAWLFFQLQFFGQDFWGTLFRLMLAVGLNLSFGSQAVLRIFRCLLNVSPSASLLEG